MVSIMGLKTFWHPVQMINYKYGVIFIWKMVSGQEPSDPVYPIDTDPHPARERTAGNWPREGFGIRIQVLIEDSNPRPGP